MSTIKSSDEHLTLNADGTSKDIKFQANGVEKASISSAGAFTSTTIDATKLTGDLPAISGANLTGLSSFNPDGAVTINESGADVDLRVESDTNTHALFVQGSDGNVGIGRTPAALLHLQSTVPEIRFTYTGNSGYSHIKGNGSNELIFSTGTTTGTERMRIDSSGNVLIGKTTAGSAEGCQLEPVGTAFLVRSNGPAAICGRNDSTGEVIRIVDSGSTVGTISVNGSATAYNTTSDYRLKENVDYTWDATTRLKQLKPARFNFIADDTNTLVDGFIAHEVSSVVPEAISGEKDAMTEEVLYTEGDDIPEGKSVGDVKTAAAIDPQGIDQSKLVPLLVKTIQELEARIAALEA